MSNSSMDRRLTSMSKKEAAGMMKLGANASNLSFSSSGGGGKSAAAAGKKQMMRSTTAGKKSKDGDCRIF